MLEPLFFNYQGLLDKTLHLDFKNSDASSERTQLAGKQASWFAGVLSIICLAVGITFTFLIVISLNRVLKRVAGSLNEGSGQVVSAASQVSASSQMLAEGASEQAASLEETSSSLEEMSTMTKRNAENAQKANALARQAREAADTGATDMQQMNVAMEAIKTSSDDIAKIIKTIDEIAFQTNLLALNAAVEAARAGEAGMGFAVVADEVRNLAQRSANAAKETAAKIEGAIGKTAHGVTISNKVAEALNQIVSRAREVDELVGEVASASREQTQGIAQINLAIGQMDKVTQSNAASAEQSAAAAQELNGQACCMQEGVAELLRLVGSEASAAKPADPAKSAHADEVTRKQPARPKRSNSLRREHPEPATVAPASKPAAVSASRSAIPMDGDFENF
ncbi:MAG: hypothetical protein H7Y43_08690 [Akkermansiaceae bacterium]|nr:hypothetical protein [Verrucomicrobiales bacterium]